MTIETGINIMEIKQVMSQWWHKSENEINENRQIIIKELSTECGQQDLSTITGFLVARQINGCILSGIILDELTRTAEHVARKDKFADEVKTRDGGRCRLTGNRTGIQSAHILDFALCINDVERYDINNGLCLDMKVHWYWDTGLIICEPDYDNLIARFRISEFAELDSEDCDEIQYALKSNDGRIDIPVSCEMMEYIERRYELDCARFGGC